jgi:hypothetical protein
VGGWNPLFTGKDSGIVVTRFVELKQCGRCKIAGNFTDGGLCGKRRTTDGNGSTDCPIRKVERSKNSESRPPFSLNPDTTDAFVYMDEQDFHFLINRFGSFFRREVILGIFTRQ